MSAVGALHHHNLDPFLLLGYPLVGDRGEIETGHHDRGPVTIVE